MDILTNLGINSTVGIQFLIFLVAYMALKTLVFSPYVRALEERENRTSGQEEAAEGLQAKTLELTEKYSEMARTQTAKVQDLFAAAKKDANAEYQRLIADAKSQAQSEVENSRSKIQSEIEMAKESIKAEIPAVSQLITAKVIGREF